MNVNMLCFYIYVFNYRADDEPICLKQLQFQDNLKKGLVDVPFQD